ncbi:fasciclin domain-containing protein [Flavobacteriales bacterium]|nr:fasciclin domain-containing protein [Flavobacteriales bacterium]
MKKFFFSVLSFITILNVNAQCEADHTVLLNDFNFVPSELVILPGESVAFINIQGNHDLNGGINSVTGESFENPVEFNLEPTIGSAEGVCMDTLVFDVPGVYNFDSSVNFDAQSGMSFTLTVDAFDLNDLLNSMENVFESAYAFQAFTPGYLTSSGPWTLFVPNEAAIDDIQAYMSLGQFDMLSIPDFPEIMQYHIAPGIFMAEDLADGMSLTSAQGQTLDITEVGGSFYVENAQIVSTNFTAYNGVVHVIDQCLAPDSLPGANVMKVIEESPDHQIFEQAIIAANLNNDLSFQATIDNSYDGPGPWTVFAPTDNAFEVFAASLNMTVDEFIDSQYLYEIVTQHIVNGCVDNFNSPNEIDNDCFDGLSNAITTSTISAGTVATNLDGNPLQFNVLDNGTISVIGLNNTVNITVSDILTYNGVVHVVDAVLSTKIAPLEGTCGTWTLELQNNFGSGWDDSYLYVQVNEETIDNVTILQGNSTTFEFAVNQGDVVNLIYNGDAYGHAYALFDEDNTIIVQANGDANGDIASYNGLIACQPANNSEFYCGDFTVELYNDMGYGWVYSSLDVYRNGIFESALEMPIGYGPLITSISAIYNDSFDFVVNSLLQFPEEIGGYKIRSQTGGILVNENYVNQGPQNAFDIVICESESGLSIEESSGKEARLVKMIDVLGKVQNEHLNGVLLFYVFDNGRVEKRFKQ